MSKTVVHCVVIPTVEREAMMPTLYDALPGNTELRVWQEFLFSGQGELQGKLKPCRTCEENSKTPAGAPLHPWKWPARPWSQAPFGGKFLWS